MTSDRRVLILFEGKTDRKLFSTLRNFGTFSSLLDEDAYVPVLLRTSIYELYEPLIESGEYDSLLVYLYSKHLLEPPENVRPSDMFPLVYLVFDFDPRYHLYNEEKIRALQEYFSDETRNGLLYLNYPMVESLFDLQNDAGEWSVTKQRPLSCCSSDGYKSLVRKQSPFRSPSGHPLQVLPPSLFAKVGLYSLARYQELMGASGDWTFTDVAGLLEKEIDGVKNEVVFPLCCLPFMALDYNVKKTLDEWAACIAESNV